MDSQQKRVHTLCIDTGPIIKDVPSISSLLAQAETIVTVPAVVDEIRDSATRSRFETTIKPFLELRSPSEASLKAIQDFARRTGDLSVLSRQDIQLLALTRDVEIERNGGDWRLRNVPGQKTVNGSKPEKPSSESVEGTEAATQVDETHESAGVSTVQAAEESISLLDNAASESNAVPDRLEPSVPAQGPSEIPQDGGFADVSGSTEDDINKALESASLDESQKESYPIEATEEAGEHSSGSENEASAAEDNDDDGWITPSNLKRHMATDTDATASDLSNQPQRILQAALLTSDFAMQNVALQMNLNLLTSTSSNLKQVRHLRTYVLRCHACFMVVKDTAKQFCPRCGKPSLSRVSCSTTAAGGFKLHLKKNFQVNTRGERFSMPKAATAGANGKVRHGGGKGGWGADLILAEDQKEYVNALSRQSRERKVNLMDEDAPLGILSGSGGRREGGRSATGKIRIGAGRNVNSRKRT